MQVIHADWVDFLIGGQNEQLLARRKELGKTDSRSKGEVLAFADGCRVVNDKFIVGVVHAEEAGGRILGHDFAEASPNRAPVEKR